MFERGVPKKMTWTEAGVVRHHRCRHGPCHRDCFDGEMVANNRIDCLVVVVGGCDCVGYWHWFPW